MKFYKCPICGNIIQIIEGDISHITCCGKVMEEMKASMQDGAIEKHVPVYDIVEDEIFVKVNHVMEKEHFIEWIAVETTRGVYRKQLSPSCKPCADFCLTEGESFIAAYAYCNLHGLWKNS